MSQQALDALSRIVTDLRSKYRPRILSRGHLLMKVPNRTSDDVRKRAAVELRDLVVITARGAYSKYFDP